MMQASRWSVQHFAECHRQEQPRIIVAVMGCNITIWLIAEREEKIVVHGLTSLLQLFHAA